MALLFLCGLMGSGKSTVGPLVATRLGVPFVDLDAEIERRAGQSVRDIFEREGEAGFRRREVEAVRWATTLPDGVVALGGGAVCREENLAAVLGAGQLVWLDAPTEILVARIGDPAARPMLGAAPERALARLRQERAASYGRAHLRVASGEGSPADVADRIVEWLNR